LPPPFWDARGSGTGRILTSGYALKSFERIRVFADE
jgi:hypothetical protein